MAKDDTKTDVKKDEPKAEPKKAPSYKAQAHGKNTMLTYPSKGMALDDFGRPRNNGHSILADVDGTDTWVHDEHASFNSSDGTVTMPAWHAKDLGLPTPMDEEDELPPVFEPKSAGSSNSTPDSKVPDNKVL